MSDIPENTIYADAGFSLIWNDELGTIEFTSHGKGVTKAEVPEIIKYLTSLAQDVDDELDCCGEPRPEGAVAYLPEFAGHLSDEYFEKLEKETENDT